MLLGRPLKTKQFNRMFMYDVGGTKANLFLRNQSREYQNVKTELFYLYLLPVKDRMGYFVHHSIVIQWKKMQENLIPHVTPNEIQPIVFTQENKKTTEKFSSCSKILKLEVKFWRNRWLINRWQYSMVQN